MSEEKKTYHLVGIIVLLFIVEVFIMTLMVGGYYSFRNLNPSVTLQHPQYFPAVAALSMASVFFIFFVRWRNNALAKLGGTKVLQVLMPRMSPNRAVGKYILWRMGVAMLGIALLGPKIASKIESVETRGIDIMVALDVSNSMLAEDLKPNRIEHAKRIVQQLINEVKGDRIGIVIFAGDAYVQLPLTSDVTSAKVFLKAINTGIVPTQGTAIGAAIDLCLEGFDPETDAGKMILLITDGENHEDDAVEAAERAAEAGVKVCAIGAGLPGGAPIPRYNSRNQRLGYRTDGAGNTIVTALNENLLIDIVKAGNGVFVRSNAESTSLTPILDEKESIVKGELGSSSFTDYKHLFPYFVLIACFFFVVDLLIAEKRWSKKWNVT